MGGGDQTGGSDQTGGGCANGKGVISLTNKNVSISYLNSNYKVRFFQNFKPPSPISEKKPNLNNFSNLGRPLFPNNPNKVFTRTLFRRQQAFKESK